MRGEGESSRMGWGCVIERGGTCLRLRGGEESLGVCGREQHLEQVKVFSVLKECFRQGDGMRMSEMTLRFSTHY